MPAGRAAAPPRRRRRAGWEDRMPPDHQPTIVPGRACGACAMCCKLQHIAELQKPIGVWCPHVVLGKGCGIYGERPGSCRQFFCLWMQDKDLGPEWKPDRAKFVLYLQRNSPNLQVAVDRNVPSAWRREPYRGRLARWAREGAEHGRFVFVRIGARVIVILPDGERDIGEVAQEDDIRIARRMTPAGFDYAVEVVKGGAR
jgi:hypothetical protein